MSGITSELRLLLMTEFAFSSVCSRSRSEVVDAIAAYLCYNGPIRIILGLPNKTFSAESP